MASPLAGLRLYERPHFKAHPLRRREEVSESKGRETSQDRMELGAAQQASEGAGESGGDLGDASEGAGMMFFLGLAVGILAVCVITEMSSPRGWR
jgi:hypothetical protein